MSRNQRQDTRAREMLKAAWRSPLLLVVVGGHLVAITALSLLGSSTGGDWSGSTSSPEPLVRPEDIAWLDADLTLPPAEQPPIADSPPAPVVVEPVPPPTAPEPKIDPLPEPVLAPEPEVKLPPEVRVAEAPKPEPKLEPEPKPEPAPPELAHDPEPAPVVEPPVKSAPEEVAKLEPKTPAPPPFPKVEVKPATAPATPEPTPPKADPVKKPEPEIRRAEIVKPAPPPAPAPAEAAPVKAAKRGLFRSSAPAELTLEQMQAYQREIHDNFSREWLRPFHLAYAGKELVATVRFRIRRDGAISNVTLARPSGNREMDDSVLKAAKRVRQVAPIPADARSKYYEIFVEFALTPVRK